MPDETNKAYLRLAIILEIILEVFEQVSRYEPKAQELLFEEEVLPHLKPLIEEA